MKVLLVRLSSMGDLIHTLPAIEDLSRIRPDVELHWLCEAAFSDIARLHPFVKQVHTLEWRHWRKHLNESGTWRAMNQLCKTLWREHYDFVLDSQGLFKSALFAKMANAPTQGLDRYSAREGWAALAYNKTYYVRKGQDAVLRNRLLFAQAFDYKLPQEMRFGLVVPEAGYLQGLSENYHVALHATSRDSKLWPNEYWSAFLEELHKYDGSTIYLPWGNETEKLRAELFAAKLPFAVACNKLNLLQAAWLLNGAKSVIGVDTGLLHLANALDKPLVGIYTDSDPVKTGVQTSAYAKNIGGIGQLPKVEDTFRLWQECLSEYNRLKA